MALPSTSVLEVRTTGNDSNGGGFNSARGGSDYSQQDSAQATGTVTSSTTTVTATTAIFTSVMVGNYITDGTTWKEITAFTSTTVVTVDSAPAWTAATINVGGALATLTKALAIQVANNLIWLKQGAYTMAANPTINASGATPAGTSTFYNRISGYAVTRGDNPVDNTRPTVTATSACTTVLPISGSTGFYVENLIIDCGTTIANVGIALGQWATVRNCWIKNFKQYGINCSQLTVHILESEVSGGTSAATAAINTSVSSLTVKNCYIHNNACSGITATSSGTLFIAIKNIVANNTGATSDGISSAYGSHIESNVFYANGRDGYRAGDQFLMGRAIRNNIFVNNGGFGLNFPTSISSFGAMSEFNNNAFFGNTSGVRNGITAGANDVTMTVSPFTNAGSGDFSLNNTAGGGAACRAAGLPGVFPGGLTQGFLDIGSSQSQASTAGGLMLANDFSGGYTG